MCKLQLISTVLIAVAAVMTANDSYATLVVSSSTGDALPKSSIFDRKGNLIGLGTDDGTIPQLPLASYPLTIRYLGFSPVIVTDPSADRIELQELDYDLPEIVIDTQSHNIVHLLGYMREYSTMSDSKDTVLLFSEKIVDFMVPQGKVKKFKGWKSPRILASRDYYRFTNSEGLDSVSDKFDDDFSWLGFMDILSKKIKVPESIINEEVKLDTIQGKHGAQMIWRKVGESYFLDMDMLADKKDHKWSPAILKLFGLTTEFIKLDSSYTFSDLQTGEVSTENIAQSSFCIEALCKGKVFRWATGNKDPFRIRSYYEFFVTDREFLSVEDALEWKDNPEARNISITPPPGIPPLEPYIIDLERRVTN